MRPLIARRAPAPKATVTATADPAPSRLSFRVTRLWLTPVFRRALHWGVPLAALAGVGFWYLSDTARLTALYDAAAEIRREIEARPEFRVNVMAIDGASPQLTEEVRAALSLDLPISSFDLDLDDLRGRIEALPPVRTASLRIQSGGYLAVSIDERRPEVLWLTHDDLSILDADGAFIGGFGSRDLDRVLPVIAGEGADLAVREAKALIHSARQLGGRLHGLVRVGERRWDVVLIDGTRIMLPESGAEEALARVLALDADDDLLSRDIASVDLRNPARLTVRVTPQALPELQRLRGQIPLEPNGETPL